ncbi:MAG: dihydropteroate synthase [Pseudomonadota bacterium]|nr:dihydropteroate synthase [Pseudomonadota bacterium]
MVALFGIVNLAPGSFSEDGLTCTDSAVLHARQLLAAGADAIDLGPSPSNQEADITSPEIEIQRLAPVMDALQQSGVSAISVDSFHPTTQRFAISRGAAFINDVHGFPHPEFYPELAEAKCKLIVMHNVHGTGLTRKIVSDPKTILEKVRQFFDQRINALMRAGIDKSRLILDPGMGFFLSWEVDASIVVLQNLERLRAEFNLPMMVGVSRKSFVRTITARQATESGYGTLAAELYASDQGVDWIRTHDVAALRDGLAMQRKLGEPHG